MKRDVVFGVESGFRHRGKMCSGADPGFWFTAFSHQGLMGKFVALCLPSWGKAHCFCTVDTGQCRKMVQMKQHGHGPEETQIHQKSSLAWAKTSVFGKFAGDGRSSATKIQGEGCVFCIAAYTSLLLLSTRVCHALNTALLKEAWVLRRLIRRCFFFNLKKFLAKKRQTRVRPPVMNLAAHMDLGFWVRTKAWSMVVLFIYHSCTAGGGWCLSGCQGSGLLSRGDAGELRWWG